MYLPETGLLPISESTGLLTPKINDISGLVMEEQDRKDSRAGHENGSWRDHTKRYRQFAEDTLTRDDCSKRNSAQPENPTQQLQNSFKPMMPSVQSAPLRWLERRFPLKRQKILLFLGLCLGWCLAFAVLSDTSVVPTNIDGVFRPVRQLTCTDSFWSPDYGCGLNGENCPAPSEEPVAFHCPARCAATKVDKPHLVGPQSVVDQPVVIGGPIHRADSWICAAAVHADLLDDSRGGCGALTRLLQTNSYPGSRFNGVSSVGVRTYFPHSYRFKFDSGFDCHVSDHRWLLPYVSVAFTSLVSLFTTSPVVLFSVAVGTGFAQLRVLSTASDEAGGLSYVAAAARYIPAVIFLALVYKCSVRTTLYRMTAQLEKTIFWLGACWIGLLQGHIFQESHFATPCLVVFVALHQMYELHRNRSLHKSIPLYATFSALAVFSLLSNAVPQHVLILGLLLLPGSAIQSRPNLVFQGLLVGLLVSGLIGQSLLPWVRPFSWDPAPASAAQATAAVIVPPEVHEPQISMADSFANITFTWAAPVPDAVDGISMLINDVERGRVLFGSGAEDKLVWMRGPQAVADYIRFGWVRNNELVRYGDFGVWKVDGVWIGLGGDGK